MAPTTDTGGLAGAAPRESPEPQRPFWRRRKTRETGIATLFLLLQFLMALQKIADAQDEYARAAVTIWWAVMGILIVFGSLYPALTLSTPEEVSRKSGRLEEMPDTIRLARQAYRRVYAAMVVRYYGILSGMTMCMICRL